MGCSKSIINVLENQDSQDRRRYTCNTKEVRLKTKTKTNILNLIRKYIGTHENLALSSGKA